MREMRFEGGPDFDEQRLQLRVLRAQGCDDVQGFLFSKPLRPDQMDFSNRKASALFEILSMGAAD